MRRGTAAMGIAVLVAWQGLGVVWGFECPARIEEAKAAAKAAARPPLTKAKEILAQAEVEHKNAGNDVKKHAEAVREARTAQGHAEEARLIAEHF